MDLVYSEGARVSSILWWDRCNISQQRHSVGSGGYRDPSDPNYIYLETQLFEEGLESKTLDEIKDRIRRVEKDGLRYSDKFKSHFLVPSFYLDE
ncbi:MAG: hypothetical protein IJV00_06860 [Clostridia bacterium]|nr:hypothetical protein [Clostridia bacterium]